MNMKNIAVFLALALLLPASVFAQAQTNTKKQKKETKVCKVVKDTRESDCGSDGATIGSLWREIGGQYTADGYEPDFFSVPSIVTNALNTSTADGPEADYLEPINDTVFNEAYRRSQGNKNKNNFQSILLKNYRKVKAEYELDDADWIAAEEELSVIINTWDMNASFDKYPYLIDPEYRHASEDTQKRVTKHYKDKYEPKSPQLW